MSIKCFKLKTFTPIPSIVIPRFIRGIHWTTYVSVGMDYPDEPGNDGDGGEKVLGLYVGEWV